jgi:hypothetical protein
MQSINEDKGILDVPFKYRNTEPEPTPEPGPQLANETLSPNPDRNQPGIVNPLINPEKLSRVPAATDYVFDTVLDQRTSLRLPVSSVKRFSGRRR